MLSSQITWWDILWIVQSLIVVIAIFIAYREGEKRGLEKAKYRKLSKHYKLPAKSESDDNYLNGLSVLQGGRMASQAIRRDIRKMKHRR